MECTSTVMIWRSWVQIPVKSNFGWVVFLSCTSTKHKKESVVSLHFALWISTKQQDQFTSIFLKNIFHCICHVNNYAPANRGHMHHSNNQSLHWAFCLSGRLSRNYIDYPSKPTNLNSSCCLNYPDACNQNVCWNKWKSMERCEIVCLT